MSKVHWFNLLLCGFLLGSIATGFFTPKTAQAEVDGFDLRQIASAIESVAHAIEHHK